MRFRQVAKTCLFAACAARAGSDDSFVNSIVFASSPSKRSLAAAWRPLWARRLQLDIPRGNYCDRGGANSPSRSKSSREVGCPKMRNCRRIDNPPVEPPARLVQGVRPSRAQAKRAHVNLRAKHHSVAFCYREPRQIACKAVK